MARPPWVVLSPGAGAVSMFVEQHVWHVGQRLFAELAAFSPQALSRFARLMMVCHTTRHSTVRCQATPGQRCPSRSSFPNMVGSAASGSPECSHTSTQLVGGMAWGSLEIDCWPDPAQGYFGLVAPGTFLRRRQPIPTLSERAPPGCQAPRPRPAGATTRPERPPARTQPPRTAIGLVGRRISSSTQSMSKGRLLSRRGCPPTTRSTTPPSAASTFPDHRGRPAKR